MINGFDVNNYVNTQKKEIIKQINKYGKLYLELGGKLFDDYHASRVLPGFEPDTKMNIFSDLKEISELIICINSENIQNERIRSDYNTLYIDDCIRLIDNYQKMGFLVSGVALTLYKEQPKAVMFSEKLKQMGKNVYYLKYIPNYPDDFEATIKSFESNDFIITTKPLVIMTSSGSASGKLSACLSQIYKEYMNGNKVGYAKYDIFPVWNLPVNHPINLAFEAATADSKDEILIDKFYYEKHHKIVSNYNRDMDLFPTIKKIFEIINDGNSVYSSPTEMVINTMKSSIIDEKLVCMMGRAEICRRYLTYWKQHLRGNIDKMPILRCKQIMDKNGITMDDFEIVNISRKIFKDNPNKKMLVLELKKGDIIIAEEHNNLSIGANMLINVFNSLVGDDSIIDRLNKKDEKICVSDIVEICTEIKEYNNVLRQLRGCNAHTSYIITEKEEAEIRSIGINITCEPILLTKVSS